MRSKKAGPFILSNGQLSFIGGLVHGTVGPCIMCDPGCRDDLHKEKKDLVSHLSQKYEKWWDSISSDDPSRWRFGNRSGQAGIEEQGLEEKEETQAK